MNVFQLFNKISTRAKASDLPDTSFKVPTSHSAAVNNFHNNYNRFIGTRITDNTSRIIRSRDEKERKGSFKLICNFLQYQAAPEIEIDKFSGNQLNYQYFVSVFNDVVE